MNRCPFCDPDPQKIFHEGDLVRGLWDAFPVSEGHALLTTRRHVGSWFEASDGERAALGAATLLARTRIRERFGEVEDFNIGVNVGTYAGQTVDHLHVHVIPRRSGDVPDPTGGVRHVIPGRGNYRILDMGASTDPRLVTTGGDRPLLPMLLEDISRSSELNVAVAFVLKSGIERIYDYLEELLARGGSLRLLAGDYLDVTDPDALRRLMDLGVTRSRVELRVFESAGTSFHPKAYIVSGGVHGVAYVGSSNLSESALEEGVEWNFRVLERRDSAGSARSAKRSRPCSGILDPFARRRLARVVPGPPASAGGRPGGRCPGTRPGPAGAE